MMGSNICAVETGEEDEDTIFNARVKLYHFEKEWKEKGTGVLKVNVRQEVRSEPPSTEADLEAGDSAGSELKARIIMRADGVHRVILNSPVFKEMKVGTQDGEPPTGKTMFLTGMEDGKPRLFQIKVRSSYGRVSLYTDIKADGQRRGSERTILQDYGVQRRPVED